MLIRGRRAFAGGADAGTCEEWDKFSPGSAIRRAGYAGFKRNVAVAKRVFPDRRIVLIDTMALNYESGRIHCYVRNQPAVGR